MICGPNGEAIPVKECNAHETLKLYKVSIRGGFNVMSTDYHESYVVARSPNDAYARVKKFLDDNDLCFSDERELKRIELIAECRRYPACQTMLFVEGETL